MKTQISRDAHRPDDRYSGVYQQQGRMLTDADWNVLSEIVKSRLDEALRDVIGSGAPRERGFAVLQGAGGPDFRAGRLYAGGVPAEVVPARQGELFGYDNQADFPAPPPLPAGSAYVLYADVWERTVDSLEDADPWQTDHLRDPALHGADTTTRTQTMAQIKWCPPFPPPEDLEANLPIGNSLLTVALRVSQAGSDPCDPCAAEVAVARRTGNYLFRLEVHHVGAQPSAPPAELILKWSSENGAEQHRVGTEPPDFKTGDHVYEFFNEQTEKHLGVHLATGFEPARGELHGAYPETPPDGFDRVRRWDGYAMLVRRGGAWSFAKGGRSRDRDVRLRPSDDGTAPGDVRLSNDEIVLHLQSLVLTFQTRSLVAGDYWLAPVRESIHRPDDENARTVLAASRPAGILHRYLRLAEIGADGTLQPLGTNQTQSLRFPPLTGLGAPDVDYLSACSEGFFRDTGQGPIDTVQKALDRLCTISAADIAFPKPCDTSLYAGVSPRRLRTVADALRLLCDIEARHVEFTPPDNCALLAGTATVQEAVSRVCGIGAEHIAYTAHAGCLNLNPDIKNVKDALDTLCARPSGRGGGCEVTVGEGGEFRTLEEAVTTLLGQGKTDLCLCLLAGEHRVEGVVLTIDRAQNLSICGCGPGSRLVITQASLVINAVRSVRIERLQIELGPLVQLTVQGGRDVAIEDVVVTGRAQTRPAAVVLQASTSVRVASSRFLFPNREAAVTLGNVFTELHPPLRDLFGAELDDEQLESQRNAVADTLVGLPARQRVALVRGLTAAISRAPLPEFVQRGLQRFNEALQATDRPSIVSNLDETRKMALRSTPSLALAVQTAGDATLVDNQILGVVSIYGDPQPDIPTVEQLRQLHPKLQRDAAGRVPVQLVPGAGRLTLDRNELSRLVVGGPPQQLLRRFVEQAAGTLSGIHRTACLAQNRFTLGGNRILARDVRLTDNFFEPVEPELGVAIADTATYLGNDSEENDLFLFHNITRRHNGQTNRDVNTMFIV